MKKLLLLLLVFTGMVSTASAAKLYVCVDNFSWWEDHVRIYAWGGTEAATSDFRSASKTYIRGRAWYVYTMTNGNTTAQIRYRKDDGENGTAFSQTINVSSDIYVIPYDEKDGSGNYKYNYYSAPHAPVCRNNIDDNWSSTSNNMTRVDDNTFYYEWSKDDIDNNTTVWFRIYYWDTQLYRKNDADRIAIAGSTSDYNANASESSWSFGVNVPDYDFEKIRVTVKSSSSAAGYEISADAYISKTLPVSEGGTYYGTFGSEADVDFTNVSGLTAQKITAASLATGVLTPTTATTLHAGEGALLSATSAGPFSIPVAASADADASNLLVAGTGASVAEEADGYTNFILTNRKVDGNGDDVDADLKFYKVNVSKVIPKGSAYLHVLTSALSPTLQFLWFDNDMTGIEKVSVETKALNGAVYNLNGQRVAQPTKGLYIVNGKKVILK